MATDGVFYVFLFASDLARSKRFYGETLGFTLGTDETDVAGFAFGGGYLVIHQDDRPAEARRYAGGMHVALKLDDVVAERARLVARGVAVSDIRDQPWGQRDFVFDDPDGYTWVYAAPHRASSV
jgi:catechol 2,3-dioxygenase-like lactoylglutathione lyase family enzyme